MSKKRAPEPNHGQVGAMVPSLAAPACAADRACNAVERLVDDLHSSARSKLRSPKRTLQTTWKQWSPGSDGARASDTTLTKAAHTCVLKLKCGSVCILRVDRSGNCSFVVRLKRSIWEHLAKAESLSEWSDRVFYHPLQREEGVALLLGARAYNVTTAKDCVHHPHVLSLLCGMGRTGCLSKQCSGTIPKAGLKSSATFELVALPPTPLVLEECFCLLGHKATFKQQQTRADDEGDDSDVPLSQHVVDASLWGATYSTTICDTRDADRFKEAGRLIKDNKVAATLQHLQHLNAHFVHSAETLATLAKCAHGWQQAEQDEHADLLAPSDAEDSPCSLVAESPPRAAAPAAAAAPRSKGKAPAAAASRQAAEASAKRGRAKKADEDEEMAEEDEFEGSSVQASSEEETSQGEDDEDDDDLDGRPTKRRQQRVRAEPAAEDEAEAAPPPPPVAAGLSVDALKAMCQPCCAQLARFLGANDGLLNGTTRWERLEDDHRLLHEATTVETVVAASLSLARTLMDAHTDPPEEATVLVSGRERARVRALAAKTAAFATAALDDVDRAISESRAHTENLEGLRKRGYDALEAVEGGGFGAKDGGAPSV